jgi:hypothetical protein
MTSKDTTSANPARRPATTSPRRSFYRLAFTSIFIASLALLLSYVCQGPLNLSLRAPLQSLRFRPGLDLARVRQSYAASLSSNMVYSTRSVVSDSAEKPLSAQELREWNHMAEGMEYYHNHFRHSFDTIYEVSSFQLSPSVAV